MNKEQFVSLGLTEEQAEKAAQASQDELKSFIPRHRYDEASEAKKQLESDIKERDKQLADLKKSAGDNEDLKKQIETLQSENKTKDTEYQTKIKDLQVNTAIKLAVTGLAHDPELISSLLDKTKIEVGDDGTIKSGLEDQIKALQESKAFLFVPKEEDKGNQFTFKGVKPPEGADKGGKPGAASIGESFAKAANEAAKPAQNNIWN